jgi:hypothetical protein
MPKVVISIDDDISKCPECLNDILCFEDHDTMKMNMSALIFYLGDEN